MKILRFGGLKAFFRLIEQFHTQGEPAYCGLGTLAMVLNTLDVDPERVWKGRGPRFPWFSSKIGRKTWKNPIQRLRTDGFQGVFEAFQGFKGESMAFQALALVQRVAARLLRALGGREGARHHLQQGRLTYFRGSTGCFKLLGADFERSFIRFSPVFSCFHVFSMMFPRFFLGFPRCFLNFHGFSSIFQ